MERHAYAWMLCNIPTFGLLQIVMQLGPSVHSCAWCYLSSPSGGCLSRCRGEALGDHWRVRLCRLAGEVPPRWEPASCGLLLGKPGRTFGISMRKGAYCCPQPQGSLKLRSPFFGATVLFVFSIGCTYA